MRTTFFFAMLLVGGSAGVAASADPRPLPATDSPHDSLDLAIIGAVGELQYGNVLRFDVELSNSGNESIGLRFACFEAMSYTVLLRSGGQWVVVYRRPLCASVVDAVEVPAESAIRWSASWDQVVWNPRDPDDPRDPEGPEIHAPIGAYRIEVVVAPFDSPRQFRESFEFLLIESEWSKPEVAYSVMTALAVGLSLLLAYYNWRVRHPGTAVPVSRVLLRMLYRLLHFANKVGTMGTRLSRSARDPP